MTRRLLAVELLGAALRDFAVPAIRRLADAMDPAGNAPGWTPLPDERLFVPRAWEEMDRHP